MELKRSELQHKCSSEHSGVQLEECVLVLEWLTVWKNSPPEIGSLLYSVLCSQAWLYIRSAERQSMRIKVTTLDTWLEHFSLKVPVEGKMLKMFV